MTSFSCILRPVKQLSSEVVVGAQCGSAVLRGAHVFAPGIVASPKCKTQKKTSLFELSVDVMYAFTLWSSNVKVFLCFQT